MNDMPDQPSLVEPHVMLLAKNHGSFPKLCIVCIHKPSGAVNITGEPTAEGDMRFNIDLIQLNVSWKT